MAKSESAQILANLIQSYQVIIDLVRSGYGDEELKTWFIDESNAAQEAIDSIKQKLKDTFLIDYDSKKAQTEIIKEGSEVVLMVDHMHGMKGGTAKIKSYTLPAMLSDVTMRDGMVMKNHKWLTNKEVKLK